MTDFERIVIVGAGVAGLRAAERLRELDYDGELVIIGDEARWPYHRPLVSKDLLAGSDRPADLTLQRHIDTGARWRLGTRAERLETQRKVVHLPGGEEIKYDGLIIATGVEPRHLKGVPRHSPRVHTLRTVDEALAVKKVIARSDLPIVVLGTGYIGCDVAASARKMGRDVTMVGRSRFPLRNLGNDVAAAVEKLHRKHRARMAMGTDIRNWICADDSVAMHTTDGQLLVAGAVIMAVGSIPSVEWMRGSGLVLEDGVLCESTLFAAGAQDVVVAGDCGRWPNLRFDDTPRRVEHWINAVEMGRHAAENLLMGREKAAPFMPIPRVWSGQYGVRLQISGIPSLGTDTVHLADGPAGTPGITGYVRNGKLVGVCGWDAPRAMIKWTEKLREELPVPTETKPRRPVAPKPVKSPMPAPATEPVAAQDVTVAQSVRPPMPPARQNTLAEMPTQVPGAQPPIPAMAAAGAAQLSAQMSAPAMQPVARPPAQPRNGRPPMTGRDMPPVPPPPHRQPAVPPVASRRPMPAMPRATERPAPMPAAPMSSGQMPAAAMSSGQMPSGRVAPPTGRHSAPPPSMRDVRPVEQPSGRHAKPDPRDMPLFGLDPGPLTEPVPPVRSEPFLPPTSAIPNLTAPNLSMSNMSVPNIEVPDTPAAAMRPAPPPSRQRRTGRPERDRKPLPPVPPMQGNQHPSFPNMQPVPRPGSEPLMEHPSFPSMRPVQRPPMPLMEHPSFPSMQPVARPGMEHPSFPSMHPVARPGAEDSRFPSGGAVRGFG
ncbi:NAD(P)/FAD-dependent oxidoreductase [Kibdelosporangium phytohabitans]|uniref:NAD(P)/FAD-dependent oxidoreductase n=1 Tax=Kibdelosporangium phytohabitans TaxID=860235 RepID=UPI0007C64B1C|nr:FAD-dependent oxidoreductase [Kibdelosporangium phytohabitans]MBE1468474.1 NADPH-dependent 2,4-dienoyl-CoA reductase/sulfur reductase-like enzyme [Kibdelosporangium phytohabitans]